MFIRIALFLFIIGSPFAATQAAFADDSGGANGCTERPGSCGK
jgi:hypothetical protein